MAFKLSELDPKLRARVVDQITREDAEAGKLTPGLVIAYAAKHTAEQLKPALKTLAEAASPAGQRIRQERRPLMNKLEKAWFDSLFVCGFHGQPVEHLRAQALRFKLGNGLWYKPDLTCVHGGRPTAFEVKGPWATEAGIQKVKAAAHQWPDWDWWLVWREGTLWREQLVLP